MPIAHLELKHVALAGSKAVTLGRMIRGGLTVPPGFVLTTAAFHRYVESMPGWNVIQSEFAHFKGSDSVEAESWSKRFLDILSGLSLPREVA